MRRDLVLYHRLRTTIRFPWEVVQAISVMVGEFSLSKFRINEISLFLAGVQHLSFRQVKYYLERFYPSVAWMMPEFVYVPAWLVGALNHKL